jgi:uridine kinase
VIGDIITIRDEYKATANDLIEKIGLRSFETIQRLVIGIAGESGSGKSVTAVCLQQALAQMQYRALILHQDDYFKLPPSSNHQQRLLSLEHVGPQEVWLDILQDHIEEFRRGDETIEKPVVFYKQNQILSETIAVDPYDVLIVEGTYVFQLEHLDFLVFMDRTYQETVQQRKDRGREVMDPFIEEVLKREHTFIRPSREKAHFIIDQSYKVINPKAL